MSFGNTYSIKPTLDHELGHYYMDKLNESRGMGDWPRDEDFMDIERIGVQFVSEGMAEYFKKALNNEKDTCPDAWPNDLFKWTWADMYDGGAHLVKPIISKHGERGIVYLMDNPPALGDFNNLKAYQDRILEELSEQEEQQQ